MTLFATSTRNARKFNEHFSVLGRILDIIVTESRKAIEIDKIT
jgi:hypothetical protein